MNNTATAPRRAQQQRPSRGLTRQRFAALPLQPLSDLRCRVPSMVLFDGLHARRSPLDRQWRVWGEVDGRPVVLGVHTSLSEACRQARSQSSTNVR